MDVVDNGLRYDLTVPLVRYYSKMPTIYHHHLRHYRWEMFGVQTDHKGGRYRQFMQCDIDILGDPSNLAEIELILATTTTLGKLGFKNFRLELMKEEF